MIPKDVCEKVFTWNPSNCECECDKSFDVGEYLDYENCKCRKKLLDKLVEECTETVEEVKLAKITSAERKNRCGCSSCTLCYFQYFWQLGIGTYFVYYKYMNHCYLKKLLLLLSLVSVLKQQFNELINEKYQRN